MNNSIQSAGTQDILTALITILQENGNQASVQQIYEQLPAKLSATIADRDQIQQILKAYSSDILANEAQEGTVIRLFEDLGDGSYELIADTETCQAIQGQKGSTVDPSLVPPADLSDSQQAKADQLLEDQRISVPDTSFADQIVEGEDWKTMKKEQKRKAQDDKAVWKAAKKEQKRQNQDGKADWKEMKKEQKRQAQDDKAVWKTAKHEQKQQAKDENAVAKALENEQKQQAKDAKADTKSANRIDKAERVIADEERKIADHEQQIERDSTRFMKSIHEMEIRHDEKVIDRKESEIQKLESDIENRS